MIRKILSLLTAVCILSSALSAYAAEQFTALVNYNPKEGEVAVSGIAPKGEIAVMIAPESMSPEEMTEENLPTAIRMFKANGAYSVSVGIPQDTVSGKYNVYVSCGEEEIVESFIYMNIAESEKIIPIINGLDGKEFIDTVSENAQNLGIDTDDAGYIAKRSSIFEIMDNMTYTDNFDFYDKYVMVYALCMIQDNQSVSEIKALLEKYADNLGIDYTSDFTDDKKLTDDAKKELCVLLSGIKYANEADISGNIDFKAIMSELKPVAAIRTVKNWVGLKEAITQNFAEEFEQMISSNKKYDKIKDKDTVFEEMIKSEFESMDEVKKVFGSAVDKIYKKENSSSSGSGSGSGSGGSLSGAISTPPESVTEQNKIEENAGTELVDMDSTHWAYVAVITLANDKVISGYEDGTFRPSAHITRAEFAKMILGYAAGLPMGETVSFEDVSSDDWYYQSVTSAAAKGLVSGMGSEFCPNEYIKREDAALIVYRLLNLLGNSPGGYRPFADRKDISEYAKEAVYTLGGAYIVQGNEDNMFLPQNSITRAEAAQLLYNAMKKK